MALQNSINAPTPFEVVNGGTSNNGSSTNSHITSTSSIASIYMVCVLNAPAFAHDIMHYKEYLL